MIPGLIRRYTKREAQQILLFESHQESGHEWQNLWGGGYLLTRMICGCGAIAIVTNPTLPEGVES